MYNSGTSLICCNYSDLAFQIAGAFFVQCSRSSNADRIIILSCGIAFYEIIDLSANHSPAAGGMVNFFGRLQLLINRKILR